MSQAFLQELKTEFDERQNELNNTLLTLEREAAQESGYSKKTGVAIIFLGALAATNAVAVKLADENTLWITIIYSAIGVLIATLGGIEAAFAFSKKAADLRVLAAKCKSHILGIDCKIPQDPEAAAEKQLDNVRELLSMQNKALEETQGKAADIGLNITRKVRKTESYIGRQLDTA